MEEEYNLVVEGYRYSLKEDADLARQEIKKIEYLEKNMDYRNPENMLQVYKKAMENRIFQTPVGWEYLKMLQDKLKEFPGQQKQVPAIELFIAFSYRGSGEYRAPKPRVIPEKKDNYKNKFIVALIVNLALAAAVAAMFFIALKSDVPNIINYENAVVNKYAQWEQQLTERENQVRESEKELSSGE